MGKTGHEIEKPAPVARREGEEGSLHIGTNVQRWTIPAREAVQIELGEAGTVLIRQPIYPGDDQVVIVNPGDVGALCGFLRAAARVALKGVAA